VNRVPVSLRCASCSAFPWDGGDPSQTRIRYIRHLAFYVISRTLELSLQLLFSGSLVEGVPSKIPTSIVLSQLLTDGLSILGSLVFHTFFVSLKSYKDYMCLMGKFLVVMLVWGDPTNLNTRILFIVLNTLSSRHEKLIVTNDS